MGRILSIILAALSLAAWVSCAGDGAAMRARLAYMDSCNRADTSFTEAWLPMADSLVKYFDRHGSATERMVAHYLQGRVYHDMGESPKALECYQKATEVADTTSGDCDFATLASIYSQSAQLYHQAALYQYEILAAKNATANYLLAGDTLKSILCYELTFSSYCFLNQRDSAELVLHKTRERYLNCRHKDKAAFSVLGLIYLYLKDSLRTSDAKELMDIFESESGLMDENGNLPPHQYQYYGYKGWYFEQTGQVDSAEYYFRKALQGETGLSPFVIAYHGLLNVYKTKKDADSIAKYSELYCKYNDSTFLNRNTGEIARMTALYNYDHHQRIADQKTSQAAKATLVIWIVMTFFSILIAAIVLSFYSYKRRKQVVINHLMEDYVKTKGLYDEKKEELVFYQANFKKIMQIKQETIDKLEEENLLNTSRYEKLKDEMDSLKDNFSNYLHEKNKEIEDLHEKVSVLKSQKDLSRLFAKYNDLLSMPIVKKILISANNSRLKISEEDWVSLRNALKSSYPRYVACLGNICVGDSQVEHAGLLMFLQFKTDEIANILGTSKQRITNIKGQLNTKLFDDSSARSFYANLRYSYNIE